MKKSIYIFYPILLASSLFLGCHKTTDDNRSKEVIIYTYDSFVAEWGAGPEIAEKFEKATGLKATFVDCGDGVQLLSRAILEKDNVQADVILGIDNNTAKQALNADILKSYRPKDADIIINPDLQNQLGTQDKLIPYDYSHFALIFNTKSNLPEPKSLTDLTNPIYKNKIILMDPRTSTPGLGFVAWTKAVFPEEQAFNDYWTSLKDNVLTMAPGWSAGYGLFTNNEAPLVISYTTSPAANLEYDKINYYKALIFEEGHIMQVEGAGILRNAKNEEGAKKFMDFLISEEAQNVLPLTQWMYPVNNSVLLPECYRESAVFPAKTLSIDVSTLNKAAETVASLLK